MFKLDLAPRPGKLSAFDVSLANESHRSPYTVGLIPTQLRWKAAMLFCFTSMCSLTERHCTTKIHCKTESRTSVTTQVPVWTEEDSAQSAVLAHKVITSCPSVLI